MDCAKDSSAQRERKRNCGKSPSVPDTLISLSAKIPPPSSSSTVVNPRTFKSRTKRLAS